MTVPSNDRTPKSGSLDRERATARPHVVIVSDDPGLREFLGQGLLLAGFWTSAIASGIQVIDVFRLRRFDLVLLDGALGGLSALDVLSRLRAEGSRGGSPLTDAPIAVVGPAEADRNALLAAGADLLLDPPLELPDLAVTLHALVDRWRTDHPEEPWSDAPPAQSSRRGDESH